MSGRWNARRFALAIAAVFAVGVALRSLPLYQSPYPFNPDGLYHARNAERAAATGSIPLSILAVDDLAFAALLAVTELLTGEKTLLISQPLIAFVGTGPALIAAAVARRLSRRLGRSPSSARFTAALAAAFLAIGGIYLHRSMPVDEQTPGLVLVPLALGCLVYGLWSDDRRWIVLAIPALAAIPPLHNLETVLTGVSVLVVTCLVASNRDLRRRHRWTVVGLAVGFWAYAAGTYLGLTRLTEVTIIQSQRMTAAPGLFVAWVVVAVAAALLFTSLGERSQRALLFAPFVGFAGLIAVNARVPLFPGTSTTDPVLLGTALGLLLPVTAAAWAYPIVARAAENRAVTVTLVAGPLAVIGFALTAALTPEYLFTALRTHWFLYVPILVVASAGTATLFRTRIGATRARRIAVTAALLTAVAISVPVAFGGLSVHSYKGVTTPSELAATGFAHERVPGAWTSDNHNVRITGYYADDFDGSEGPVYQWIHNTPDAPPACPIVTRDSWQSVGAQFYPRPTRTVPESQFERLERGSHQLYDNGGSDRIRVLLPAEDSSNACGS